MAFHRNVLLLVVFAVGMGSLGFGQDEPVIEGSTDPVGRSREDVIVTPVNQLLTPYGKQVELAGLRPQALALSPDGRLLVASGKTSELIVIDPEAGEIRQRVLFPDDSQITPASGVAVLNLPDRRGQVSFTGLIFSPDGKQIYLSNVSGTIKVFEVKEDGKVHASHVFLLPDAKAPRRPAEIPSGLAVNSDGSRLYVCGNLSNRLLELDTANGTTLRSFDVGAAPYDVVLVGNKAFVSNWAGRRPDEQSVRGPAGRGTEVRVDPIRHIASEGSVSIVNLDGQAETVELIVGLHACGLAASPDGQYVICTNAGSDHLSVIDVAAQNVVETIWAKTKPSDLFGASPNAIAFHPSSKG